MPQMAPLNYLSLFIAFVMTFMMFNSLNYFSFNYQPKSKYYQKSSNKMNWKW